MTSLNEIGVSNGPAGVVELCNGNLDLCFTSGIREYWVPHTDQIMIGINPNSHPITRYLNAPAFHTRTRLGSDREIYGMIQWYPNLERWMKENEMDQVLGQTPSGK